MTSDSLRAQNTQCFFANMEYRTRTIVDCNFIKIKFGIRQGAGPALGPADLANDVAIVKQLKTDFVHMSWKGQRKSSADPYSVLVLERQVKFFFRRPSSEVNFFNKNTTMHAPRSICVQPHCSTVVRLLQLPSHQPCAMASTATPGRQLDQHTRPVTSCSLTLGHCHCAAATSRQERTIENLSSSTKARLALHLARMLSSASRDSHSGSPTAPFLQKPAILTVPLFSFSPLSVRTARAEERPNVRDVLVQDEGPRLFFCRAKRCRRHDAHVTCLPVPPFQGTKRTGWQTNAPRAAPRKQPHPKPLRPHAQRKFQREFDPPTTSGYVMGVARFTVSQKCRIHLADITSMHPCVGLQRRV